MPLPNCKLLNALCIVFACLGFVLTASAQYHLMIDIYDPTNVTFTATDELALADDATQDAYEGILLKSFFTEPWSNSFGPGEGEGPQDLRANGMLESEPYASFATFNHFVEEVTTQDLNIYRLSSSTIQNFSTSAPAFYGVLSDDFSASPVRPIGTTGSILAGSYVPSVKIGEYIIVRNYPNPFLDHFSYDAESGTVTVTIKARALAAYKLVEADDLDFTSPDQDPVSVASASTGTLSGNIVTTTAGGEATIQFNLGISKPATFFRAVEVAP